MCTHELSIKGCINKQYLKAKAWGIEIAEKKQKQESSKAAHGSY